MFKALRIVPCKEDTDSHLDTTVQHNTKNDDSDNDISDIDINDKKAFSKNYKSCSLNEKKFTMRI